VEYSIPWNTALYYLKKYIIFFYFLLNFHQSTPFILYKLDEIFESIAYQLKIVCDRRKSFTNPEALAQAKAFVILYLQGKIITPLLIFAAVFKKNIF